MRCRVIILDYRASGIIGTIRFRVSAKYKNHIHHEKIISPYKGNVLYLDFWGMSCGPCRAGMVRQKPLLEELKGKPFKAIYIANTENGVESCRMWLRKEGIKGEHVFVSDEAWQSLRKRFNIIEIPFGMLIDKDGNVIETDLHDLPFDSPLFHKALEE